MKNIFVLLATFLIISTLYSQVPPKLPYQSVIRNANNELVSNSPVGIRISIIRGTVDGTELYVETQTPVSDSNGMISIAIGGEAGFDAVDWVNGPLFIKTEIDPDGGSNYRIEGLSELLTVPYAFHTQQAGSLDYNMLENLPELFDGQYESLVNAPVLPEDISQLDDEANLLLEDGAVAGQFLYWDGAKWQALAPGDEGMKLTFCDGIPTWGECIEGVIDVDGNEYPTVVFGEQEWMAENLKTTRYKDGREITYIGDDNQAWWNVTTGAYTWYDNLEENKDLYGALYNWKAATDGDLCPAGWHVPTDDDWTQLVDFIMSEYDMDNEYPNVGALGNALKSCRQIDSPLGGECATLKHPRWDSHSSHHGNDQFGFSALPGGVRDPYGTYATRGSNGNWWSTTESDEINAFRRNLNHMFGDLSRMGYDKRHGLSVRCVKD